MIKLPVITKDSKSTKTFKLRALKYFLIEHMEMLGYDCDDEGSIITFSGNKLEAYYRPSHIDYIDVEAQAPYKKKEAASLEKEINSLLEAAIVSLNL
tara:strand:+ start:659 stop:949 length:291 start_codon:yes stop_codon:yes gene_type:complete